MRRAWLCLLAAVGCGPGGEVSGRFDFELTLSRAIKDQSSAFQVSVLANGKSFDCTTAHTDCLRNRVAADQLIPVLDGRGRQHPALLIPAELEEDGTQDLELRGIAVGKDYAVVIEALSRDNPPQLIGTSCSYLQEITSGTNPKLIATLVAAPGGVVACDPRYER